MAEWSDSEVTFRSPAARARGRDCTLSRGEHHGSGGRLPVTGAEKGPRNPPGLKETLMVENSYSCMHLDQIYSCQKLFQNSIKQAYTVISTF